MEHINKSDLLSIVNAKALSTAINTYQFSHLTTSNSSNAFYYAGPGVARIKAIGVFVGATVATGDVTMTVSVYHEGVATNALTASVVIDATLTAGGAVVADASALLDEAVAVAPGDVILCTCTATSPTATPLNVTLQVG